MIVTSDPALYDDLKSLRSHGWVRDRGDRPQWKERYPEFDDRFMFVTGGYNVRPTEIQGAIGSVQLRKLDYLLEERDALAHQVKNWLEEYTPFLRLIGSERLLPNRKKLERCSRTHSWMTLPFQLDPKAPVRVEVLKKKMELMGVETRPILAGNLCRHPATQRFKTRSAASLKQCDDLLAQGFMIGCHSVLAPGALETLASAFQCSKSIRITAAIITLGILSYYLVVTQWSFVEILRFFLGITLLKSQGRLICCASASFITT